MSNPDRIHSCQVRISETLMYLKYLVDKDFIYIFFHETTDYYDCFNTVQFLVLFFYMVST